MNDYESEADAYRAEYGAAAKEIERLRALVEEAYFEGYRNGHDDGYMARPDPPNRPGIQWDRSTARKQLMEGARDDID